MTSARQAAIVKAWAPAVLAIGGLVAYAIRLKLHPVEIARALIGLTALWGPMAALVYLMIRREVPWRIPRLTFALIASYAITTLLYFGCCVVWSKWVFYILLCLMAAGSVYLVMRGGEKSLWRNRPAIRLDWVLIFLVITSLFLFARYQVPYKVDGKTGRTRIVACLEQTYFVGQAYELARHTPPVQEACQAGVPERAYHLLPHLAAMLVAKFAGQSDIMHAHLVYHYAWLTALMCLALYSIVERLTGARGGGYAAVCFLVIFAIPFKPVGPAHIGYLYFNFFPLASSLLEPVVVTSPQMYSGLLVAFGVMLGVVLMCSQREGNGHIGVLAILSAVMVAAMSRFRVQVFIPLAPSFLIVLAFLWWKGVSRWQLVLAGAVTVVGSGLLYLETHWPGYLRGTSSLRISFLPSEPQYLGDWLFGLRVSAALRWFLSGQAYSLIWPTVETLGFVIFNGIGLPLLGISIWWFSRRKTWRQWGGYAGLTILLVGGSVLGSQIIQVGYDSYSVGGQMLLHIGWYLLPLFGVGAWGVAAFAMRHIHWQRRTFAVIGAAIVVGAVVVQLRRGPSKLDQMVIKLSVSLTKNDWASVKYLHDHTPLNAVVMSDHHLEPSTAVYPGIAGRAAYVAYVHGTLELLNRATESGKPARTRLDVIKDVWEAKSPERFMKLLRGSGVTHLIEFSDHPLNIGSRKFLEPVWESPPGNVRVRILRFVPERWSGPATVPAGATSQTVQGSGS